MSASFPAYFRTGCMLLAVCLAFAGMSVLAGESIKVGVYDPGPTKDGRPTRCDMIHSALQGCDNISAELVKGADYQGDMLKKFDVYVFPNSGGTKRLSPEKLEALKKWVGEGHGLLASHDAVGYRGHEPVFPGIAVGTGNVFDWMGTWEPHTLPLCVSADHPVTEGLPVGRVITPAYFDFIAMKPGSNTCVVLRGVECRDDVIVLGPAAVVCAEYGKGRYVACGFLLGAEAHWANAAEITGDEKKLLLNAVRYLGKLSGVDGRVTDSGVCMKEGEPLSSEAISDAESRGMDMSLEKIRRIREYRK